MLISLHALNDSAHTYRPTPHMYLKSACNALLQVTPMIYILRRVTPSPIQKKKTKKSDFVTGQPQECALNHGFLKTAIVVYVIKTWPILYSIGLV